MKQIFITPQLPIEVYAELPKNLDPVKLDLIAGVIYEHWLLKHHIIEDDLIPIHSKNFKSIDRGYKRYIDHLEYYNIIKSDNHYIVGEKSISYSIGNQDLDFKEIEISRRKYSVIRSNNSIKKYQKLYYDLHQIKVESEEAFNYLNCLSHNGLSHHATNLAKCHLLKIINKDIYFHLGAAGHRLHTNITCLKKELRNFLTIENEKIVEIDIVNSQPFISSIFLQPIDRSCFNIIKERYKEEKKI
jgi:hypothetical protein